MSFRSEIIEAARQAAGSFKTVAARAQMASQLADYLQNKNIQIRHLSDLKEKHVRGWIQESLANGVSKRSCQNRLTAVRGCLKAVGLTRKAAELQTSKFGVEKASRDGSRTAISRESYEKHLANVKDAGVASVLMLQRELGLRQREGIMAQLDTLKRWERELLHDGVIRVLAGTKGGRPRQTIVTDPKAALRAIWHAKAHAERHGGRLIDAPGLKQAVDRFNNSARGAGFVGVESPHSLRYAFARDRIEQCLALGLSRREALQLVSQDLGHGDGRGRWVDQVYSR